jgi:phosphopantothenoylcysteine synthetase/decarboxylase
LLKYWPMNCVVTAGPTYENLDKVRRLTNFSTGRLGSELAGFLAGRGHNVKLLLGEQATHRAAQHGTLAPEVFTTTADLSDRLQQLSRERVDAVFHAAAVSDFTFGKVWVRAADGRLTETTEGKISTRQGTLLAELLPTPKIIASLREWFPAAVLVGWKYEVEGTAASVIRLAERQIADCRTTACVANGPGYGIGFGLVTAGGQHRHFAEPAALFKALAELAAKQRE